MIKKVQKLKSRPVLVGIGALALIAGIGVAQWRGAASSPANSSAAAAPTADGYRPTRYSNVMVRNAPSPDGNSPVKSGAGWIYGKPSAANRGAARVLQPVVPQRGTSAAGGYYVTLPSGLYPRATAQIGRDGKLVINCANIPGEHGHDHGNQHQPVRKQVPASRR